MVTASLMVQGTTSDAGKSTLVAGLCRVLYRRGIHVAPFKPQNIALNSAVTVDGGEIGRAQALQAVAAGLEPVVDMNPVLLKPSSDNGAQVIIQGQVRGKLDAVSHDDYKAIAWEAVVDSYRRLQAQYDVVLVEGAGSPAEINLRDRDIANMGFAERVDCPVVLMADIERGGVFAHLVGTLALLSETERARIVGLVINRFRGDISLLQSGLDWLEQETGKPVLGVLPYLQGLMLDAEDGINGLEMAKADGERLKVVVPVLPHISNHTDFEPLRAHSQVDFTYLRAGETWPAADLVILPGTKNTRSDLAWLRAQGWEPALLRHLRYDGKVIGICGGFQMLGEVLSDPDGLEGNAGDSPGLGLLAMTTRLQPAKRLRRCRGRLLLGTTLTPVTGYEIHMGISRGLALERPLIQLEVGPAEVSPLQESQLEGAISADGAVLGTYWHGLFDEAATLQALLIWAGLREAQLTADYQSLQAAQLDRLADMVASHLDIDRLLSILAVSEA